MNTNEFDFLGIKEIINNLEIASEQAVESMDIMNREITTCIGIDGEIWTGEAANKFRQSWDDLASNFKEFKNILDTQITNINLVLTKMSKTEES